MSGAHVSRHWYWCWCDLSATPWDNLVELYANSTQAEIQVKAQSHINRQHH